MTSYIINRKPSGTGNIHDLASQYYDRTIRFRRGQQYAVVLAAYYTDRSGADGYTCHRTEQAAIRKARQLRDYSFAIINTAGNRYDTPDGERLVCLS